jgi:hypothetical protein
MRLEQPAPLLRITAAEIQSLVRDHAEKEGYQVDYLTEVSLEPAFFPGQLRPQLVGEFLYTLKPESKA